jgi:hypothetical protein
MASLNTNWRRQLHIDKRLQEAVQSYWNARAKNKEKQVQSGKIDARKTRITEPAEDLTFARFAAALRGQAISFSGSK